MDKKRNQILIPAIRLGGYVMRLYSEFLRPVVVSVSFTLVAGCYATERTVVNLERPTRQPVSVSETSSSQPSRQSSQPSRQSSSRASVSSPSTESGLTRITQNPSVSASVARSICEPQAKAAGAQAASQYRSPNTRYRANCRRDYFGNYDCSGSSYTAGGSWGGISAGMERGRLERQAEKAALLQCLSPLGWTKR